jgi:LL-diaminopimelate aminotransferase
MTETRRSTPTDLPRFADIAREVEVMRAEGRDVIRLDIGSPDLPPPDFVIEALQHSAAMPDRHGYQPFRGPLSLRTAWAAMYRRVFDVELDPELEVLPLLGSKEGILHLTMAHAGRDDVVLVPDPGYPTYARSARLIGASIHPLELDASRGHLPDLASMSGELLERSRLMWLNYPNNPTTATTDLRFLAEAVELARAHDILICYDAAYTRVNLDGSLQPSILQVPGAKEVSVELNSLSKSHNMAGWRLGVAVGNRHALEHLARIKADADNGHFLAVTDAAVVALAGDQAWITRRNAVYRQRAAAAVHGLELAGLAAEMPKATMYVWARLPDGWRSAEFVGRALRETGVAVTPGDTFGVRGEGYFRISLGAPLERIEEAMDRIRRWRFDGAS